ncbi:MAG: hypothetical protein ACYC5Y_04210 [Symbiobacteriia bacterium]
MRRVSITLGGWWGIARVRMVWVGWDPRIKASLMMDAAMPADVVQAGLRQPSMWITRDASWMRLERQRSGGWPEAAIAVTLSSMRTGFNKSLPGDGYYVQVPGMFHYSLAFFDQHLEGRPAALLGGPSTQYPEVLREKR